MGRGGYSETKFNSSFICAAPAESPRVLVAQGLLAAGQFVRPENLRWQAWPAEGVAASYVTESNGRIEDFVGAVVRSALNEGEPITEGRLVRPVRRSRRDVGALEMVAGHGRGEAGKRPAGRLHHLEIALQPVEGVGDQGGEAPGGERWLRFDGRGPFRGD